MFGAAFEILFTPSHQLPLVEKAKALGIVGCKWVVSLAVAAGLSGLQYLVASLISGRF